MFTELWARGVYVGSMERPLPCTPAVFERKVRWCLGDLDPLSQLERCASYTSTVKHGRQVRRQFQAEEERGSLVKMTSLEAMRRFGDFVLGFPRSHREKG